MPRKTDEVQPWEQQPGESAKAFEAFKTYRDMGAERSMRKVAQRLNKSLTMLSKWSGPWSWQERVRAYDREMDREAHETAVRELRSMTNRHIRIAMQLQTKALQALNNMDAELLSPKMTLAFLKQATELEKANRYAEAGYGQDGHKDSAGEVEIVIEGEEDDADDQS